MSVWWWLAPLLVAVEVAIGAVFIVVGDWQADMRRAQARREFLRTHPEFAELNRRIILMPSRWYVRGYRVGRFLARHGLARRAW